MVNTARTIVITKAIAFFIEDILKKKLTSYYKSCTTTLMISHKLEHTIFMIRDCYWMRQLPIRSNVEVGCGVGSATISLYASSVSTTTTASPSNSYSIVVVEKIVGY